MIPKLFDRTDDMIACEYSSLPRRYYLIFAALFGGMLCLALSQTSTERLQGRTGASIELSSGWLDLRSPLDFSKGDRLRITVGGTATNVVVRLLPRGGDPSAPEVVVSENAVVSK